MSESWIAEMRTEEGKGASRRLRRAGKIPAIIYGGKKATKAVALSSNFVEKQFMDVDNFNKSIEMDVDGKKEKVVVKDLQRHPSTSIVSHIDFQRISEKNYVSKRVPFVFEGTEIAPGVKIGGLMSFMLQTVDIRCMGKDLPSSIAVDVSKMEEGTSMRLSELELPKGVEIIALTHGSKDYDQAVVGISKVKRA